MEIKKELEKILKEFKKGRDALKRAGEVIAEHIAENLNVKKDEVAILLLTSTGTVLKFIHPVPLFEGNAAFPADYKSSFASSVLKSMKGKVDNRISESKHLKFYENVKGLDTSGLPIQKMIAVPITYEGKAIGVIEVSRKGNSLDSAGPNFTAEDGQKLVIISKEIAPYIIEIMPEPFF